MTDEERKNLKILFDAEFSKYFDEAQEFVMHKMFKDLDEDLCQILKYKDKIIYTWKQTDEPVNSICWMQISVRLPKPENLKNVDFFNVHIGYVQLNAEYTLIFHRPAKLTVYLDEKSKIPEEYNFDLVDKIAASDFISKEQYFDELEDYYIAENYDGLWRKIFEAITRNPYRYNEEEDIEFDFGSCIDEDYINDMVELQRKIDSGEIKW